MLAQKLRKVSLFLLIVNPRLIGSLQDNLLQELYVSVYWNQGFWC